MLKILRLTAKLLVLTAPLMLLSGLLTAKPHIIENISASSARLMHTAIIPSIFVPLLAIHSIMGILFLVMRNKKLNRTWIKAAAVSAWSFILIIFGSLYFLSASETSEKKITVLPVQVENISSLATEPTIELASAPKDEPKKEKPAPDGKATVEKKCASCHSLDTVLAKKRSKEDWRAVVSSMQKKGAGLTVKEVEAVIDYLASAK